jgi:hypothetical protein
MKVFSLFGIPFERVKEIITGHRLMVGNEDVGRH